MLPPHIFKLFIITIVYMYYDDLGGNYMWSSWTTCEVSSFFHLYQGSSAKTQVSRFVLQIPLLEPSHSPSL